MKIKFCKNLLRTKQRCIIDILFQRYVFDPGHPMDPMDFHERRLIESFYINSDRSSMRDKSSDMFPDIYRFWKRNDDVSFFICFI